MRATVPPGPAAAVTDLERIAEGARIAATRHALQRPERRADVLAAVLWRAGDGGIVTTARRAGAALVDLVVGSPGPPVASVEDYHRDALHSRVGGLAASGVEVIQLGGRWLQPSKSGRQQFRPVETLQTLAQQRVYRGEIRARAAVTALAHRWGFADSTVTEDGVTEWADAALKDRYEQLVAMEVGRVAHDVTTDAFRDAVFEQIERRPEVLGWRRLAEPTACGACLALATGRLEEPGHRVFYRHTRCRCIAVPETATSPPIPSGRELFDAMSEDEQDRVFHGRGGRKKAQALRDGSIELSDLVTFADERVDVTDYVIRETPLSHLSLPDSGDLN